MAGPTGRGLPHPQLTLDLAFSPDGQILATGCRDGAARRLAVEKVCWSQGR
ncbi:WD40 repeat domain-containing protein [Streptomyces canus]|uniref:WD40 repeat domain-containing protein n=1 Tax=Streptomyces canus TaxID=58343 RepID=UPI0033A463C6